MFFGKQDEKRKKCSQCSAPHPIWKCEKFKKLSYEERWKVANRNNLCYRCLGDDHIGKYCPRSSECGIGGCHATHNRFLHGKKSDGHQESHSQDNRRDTLSASESHSTTEGEPDVAFVARSYRQSRENVTLRTVSVMLSNGNRRMQVNALLDDASPKTSINADVAAELGLNGSVQKVQVSVLNNKTESFETMPVSFDIESIDGKNAHNNIGYHNESCDRQYARDRLKHAQTPVETFAGYQISISRETPNYRHVNRYRLRRPAFLNSRCSRSCEWTNREIDATWVDVHW